jgi:hypothetical protein
MERQAPEFATPIEDDEDRLDAFHNKSPVRYRRIDSVIDNDLLSRFFHWADVVNRGGCRRNFNSSLVEVRREHSPRQSKTKHGVRRCRKRSTPSRTITPGS